MVRPPALFAAVAAAFALIGAPAAAQQIQPAPNTPIIVAPNATPAPPGPYYDQIPDSGGAPEVADETDDQVPPEDVGEALPATRPAPVSRRLPTTVTTVPEDVGLAYTGAEPGLIAVLGLGLLLLGAGGRLRARGAS